MLILGIESATPIASVALADEKGLLGEVLLNVGLTHAEQLLPLVDDLLRQCRRGPDELTAIGVSAGPGSFTGLRIGMATAKALAQGISARKSAGEGGRVRLLGISTLEAMARQLMGQPVLLSPMLNARREQIYTALYRWRERRGRCEQNEAYGPGIPPDGGDGDLGEVFAARQRGKRERMPADAEGGRWRLDCLIPPCAADPGAWMERLNGYGQDIYLLGDGAAMYREIWCRVRPGRALLLPPAAGLCRGSFIALAGMDILEGNAASAGVNAPAEASAPAEVNAPAEANATADALASDAFAAPGGDTEREILEFYGMKPVYLRGI